MRCQPVLASCVGLSSRLARLALLLSAVGALAGELSVCVGRQQQPPFVFNDATGQLTGLGLDVLKAVSQQLERPPRVQSLPLARCIEELKFGRYDLALNMSSGIARRPGLLASQAYYQLRPELYALRRPNRPALPAEVWPEDLQLLRLCGLRGLSYEDFGVRSRDVDTGTNVYPELVRKLLLGRCDGLLEFRQIVAGLYLIDRETGELATSSKISRHRLRGQPDVGLHLVARSDGAGRALIASIDPVIRRLQAQGRIDTLLGAYLQP